MLRRTVKDVLLPVLVAIALAFVIQASVAKPYEIPTGSMIPTIEPNDRIIANRLIYKFRDIQRGDIIVFEPPQSAKTTCSEPTSDVPFVKRVIGLPGDRVEVRQITVPATGVYVNREQSPLSAGEVIERRLRPGETTFATFVNGKVYDVPAALTPNYAHRWPVVPKGKLLVLGDNRPGSCDSHQWVPDPFVPDGNVIGQAEITYWPLQHIKFL